MGLEALSSLRTMFAKADVFIADIISKLYLIILQIADVNLVNKAIKDVIDRVYSIIGLFMLFKIALVIINYIVDPEKQQAVGNIIKRVIIVLVLIPTVPVIFEKAYQLQGVILRDNVIGSIILGKGVGDGKQDMKKIGDEVAYLVFSNFIDYNDSGVLKPAFSDCPNIFLEEDTDQVESDPIGSYCCDTAWSCPTIPKCGWYLYYPALINPKYGMPDEDGIYPDSRDWYYKCKSGKAGWDKPDTTITRSLMWTHFCGIRDGVYIYDLINEGRKNKSVATILSEEIITAVENDPIFYNGTHEHTCEPDKELYSDGDFVFDYNFLVATIVGLIVTFLLIIICVDIGIRTVKLAFLQVMAPIPVVSYVDVKDSKLFNGWVKESITTYLQLFIRLAVVFFTVLLFKMLIDSAIQNSAIVNAFMIIGILLFAFQMPKLLCDLFNLNKENGFLSLIKNVGKFAIGSSAIGISTIGGAVSNMAATPENIKNVGSSFANASGSLKNFKTNLAQSSGVFGKLGVFGSTIKNIAGVPFSILKVPGSIVAGGISSGVRTAKKIHDNKGSYKSGDVTSSIYDSSMKREARRYGITGLDQDDIKSEISALETQQTNLQNSYEQGREDLSFRLSRENNSDDIEQAFKQQYENYTEYVSDMTVQGNSAHIINEGKYNEYDELYSRQTEMEKEMDELKERIKLLNSYLKEEK